MERTKSLQQQLGKSNYDRIPKDMVKRLDHIFDKSQTTIEKLQADLQADSFVGMEQIEGLLNSLKREKNRMEEDSALKNKQLQIVSDVRKKLQDELNNFKQINVRRTVESIEIKANILKKEEELKAIQTKLASTEDLLKESRSKEMQLKNVEIQIRKVAKKYKDSYFDLKSTVDARQAELAAKLLEEQAGIAARAELEKVQAKKLEDLSNQLLARQEEIEHLQKEIENLKKQDDKNLLADARNRIAALTETNRQITRDYEVSKNQLQTCEQSRSEHDSLIAALKSQLEAIIKELLDQDASRQETITRLTRDHETFSSRVNQLHRQFQQHGSKPSTSSGTTDKSPSDQARTANVKPMATPSTQSTPVNLRRGGDTPLASIRPVSVQNSRIAAVLPTSQSSNVAAVQGSSSSAGNVTTALVPPQQQVHTTANTSTAEAMSSSPTSSHTDYMPATSSAVVAAVPPMGSASAESTQEAESLSVNTNESSSSSSTSSPESRRIEGPSQNLSFPSENNVSLFVNKPKSSSPSSTSSQEISPQKVSNRSHHLTSTSSQGGHKRPRNADGSTDIGKSSTSEKTLPQNKRTRIGEENSNV